MEIKKGIITIALNGNSREINTSPFYQYDHGLQLRQTGLETNDDVQVHFAYRGSSQAVTMLSMHGEGEYVVNVPDTMLMQCKDVYAYVYIENETSGLTVKKVCIPILGRAKPSEVNLDTPEFGPVNQIVGELEEVIEQANEVMGEFEKVISAEEMLNKAESLETAATEAEEAIQRANAAIADIDNAIEEAIETIDNKSTSAVTEIENKTEEIIQTAADEITRIENKGEEQLAKIPEVTELAGQVSQLSEEIAEINENYLRVKETHVILVQENIYNAETATVGALGSNGAVNTSTTGYVTTAYEFVKEGSSYSAWQIYGSAAIVNPCIYDINMSFIRMLDSGSHVTIPEGVGAYYLRASFNANQATAERQLRIVEGTDEKEWTPYQNEYVSETVVTEYVKKADTLPHAYLPDEIFCALGRTIDIYNNQVCIDAAKFHLCWTCSIGYGEERKFTATPETIGNYPLKLDIYNDNNELVWSETTSLKVVDAKTDGAITVLPIGDSMTLGGGQWQNEVHTLSNSAISYVGTQETDFRGSIYLHEGYNGITANAFLHSAEYRGYANPFYNPDTAKFDWNYYKTSTGIAPDIVQIALGTNDVNGGTVAQAVSNIVEMVDLIRANDADIPIFICNAIYRSNQDGIAHQLNSQGYSAGNGVYKYGEDVKIQTLMIGLAERLKDRENIYFIPLALCHDSENNFGKKEIPLNSRSLEKTTIPADSIHPNKMGEDGSVYGYDNVGHLQFADIMFSTFSGILPTN